MRPCPEHRPLTTALAWALLVAGNAAAQVGPAPDPTSTEAPFVEQVDVEIVNVDVWVTDRDGRPVTGLTADDFVVRRDGEVVPLSNFYAVAGDGGPGPADPGGPLGAPPRAEPAQPGAAAPGPAEHRLWLVVYVDNYNLHPLHRDRILPDLELFLLRHLGPDDRAMLVTHDRTLEVRQPFTADPARLATAWNALAGEMGHGVVRASERGRTLRQIADADSESEALGYALNYADAQMSEVTATVRSLERLIDSLAGLEGRKALLYVTSGVPMLPGEEMLQAVALRYDSSRAYAEIPRHDTRRAFERVARQATANRVVFYTLDAGGLRGMTLGAAEYGSFLSLGLRSTLESTIQANQQSSLHLLADATGGLAIVNRNEVLPALAEAAADFRTFYSLGIPALTGDGGGYHRLEVEVANRDGLAVRHRRGYRSRGVDGRMIDSVRSALLYDVEANPLGVEARWGRAEAAPEERGAGRIVPVEIAVPLDSLVLLPISGERHEMRLKLYVGVVDERGDLSEVDVVPLGLRIAGEHLEAARAEAFVYTHRLRMDVGRQKVALGILDTFGNRHSIVSAHVAVGGAS